MVDDPPLEPPKGDEMFGAPGPSIAAEGVNLGPRRSVPVEIDTLVICEADLVRVAGPLGSLIWHGLTRPKPYA